MSEMKVNASDTRAGRLFGNSERENLREFNDSFKIKKVVQIKRQDFAQDCEYITFSTEFRRLAGITQVVAPLEKAVYHNRLTHTLEVARYAKRIAEYLLAIYEKGNYNEFIEKYQKYDKYMKTAFKESNFGFEKDNLTRNIEISWHRIADLDKVEDLDAEMDSALKRDWLNIEVVEAAALIHDIGHAPFGHIGEKILDSVAKKEGDIEGFEGNAQSFRIVTRLATNSPDYLGLNLTKAVLKASLKYPWVRSQNEDNLYSKKGRKFGIYSDDFKYFELILDKQIDYWRERSDLEKPFCLEAEIMDYADEVAYSIQDFFDFFKVGLIPRDAIRDLSIKSHSIKKFLNEWKIEYGSGFKEAFSVFLNDSREEIEFLENLEDFCISQIKNLLTELFESSNEDTFLDSTYINIAEKWAERFIEDNGVWIEVEDKNSKYPFLSLHINPISKMQVKFLNQIVRKYVIQKSSLESQQEGQKKIVETLFYSYLNAIKDGKKTLLPSKFHRMYDDMQRSISNAIRSLISHGISNDSSLLIFMSNYFFETLVDLKKYVEDDKTPGHILFKALRDYILEETVNILNENNLEFMLFEEQKKHIKNANTDNYLGKPLLDSLESVHIYKLVNKEIRETLKKSIVDVLNSLFSDEDFKKELKLKIIGRLDTRKRDLLYSTFGKPITNPDTENRLFEIIIYSNKPFFELFSDERDSFDGNGGVSGGDLSQFLAEYIARNLNETLKISLINQVRKNLEKYTHKKDADQIDLNPVAIWLKEIQTGLYEKGIEILEKSIHEFSIDEYTLNTIFINLDFSENDRKEFDQKLIETFKKTKKPLEKAYSLLKNHLNGSEEVKELRRNLQSIDNGNSDYRNMDELLKDIKERKIEHPCNLVTWLALKGTIRLAVDIVASFNDQQAHELYLRLLGIEFGSIDDIIL
jgi:dGTPase